MNKLPDTLRNIMFDKDNNAYAYAGILNVGSEVDGDLNMYVYTKDPTLTDRENILIDTSGLIVYGAADEEYLYLTKQDMYVEGCKYSDERNRIYTLVKDGRKDPAFTNRWVKLVFLDDEGKTKSRDGNGKSITPGYSIVRKI
jgi:hypothetical protein